jgi:hypothetical protein
MDKIERSNLILKTRNGNEWDLMANKIFKTNIEAANLSYCTIPSCIVPFFWYWKAILLMLE